MTSYRHYIYCIISHKLEGPKGSLGISTLFKKSFPSPRQHSVFSLEKNKRCASWSWRTVVPLLIYRSIKSSAQSCVWGCSACKLLLAPSAAREISAILRDICLDNADLCGPAPCALGPGWMDTRRALFPETDEFAKWKFWYKWTRGHDRLRENIQGARPGINLCFLLKQSAGCFYALHRSLRCYWSLRSHLWLEENNVISLQNEIMLN